MPYSKNPHKYPPEMLMLLEALRKSPETALRFPCTYRPEANSRKVMIQSYFRAVEREAEEQARLLVGARAKASNAAERRDRAAQATTEEYELVKGVCATWEERAFIARQWMVKVEDAPLAVVVQRRALEGSFGDSLRAFLDAAPKTPTAKGPSEDSLAAQFALLRQATEELERGGGKTD